MALGSLQTAQPVANDGAEAGPEGEAVTSDGGAGKASKAPPKGAASASGIFGAFGKRHYEGGFDEKMTRKEAALILGVRESAAPQRIKVCCIVGAQYDKRGGEGGGRCPERERAGGHICLPGSSGGAYATLVY